MTGYEKLYRLYLSEGITSWSEDYEKIMELAKVHRATVEMWDRNTDTYEIIKERG